MFKQICIELVGPICNCKKQNLAWSLLWGNISSVTFLSIFCKTCGTQLTVPPDQLFAYFKLDKPYPESVLSNPEPENDQQSKNDPFFEKLEKDFKKEPPQLS